MAAATCWKPTALAFRAQAPERLVFGLGRARAPAGHGLAPPLRVSVVSARPTVVVVYASAAPGGGGDDEQECERLRSIYRMEMQAFQMTQRRVAITGDQAGALLIAAASSTAKASQDLVDYLLGRKAVPNTVLNEVIVAGQGWITMESQASQKYLTADALVNGIQGLKLVAMTFFDEFPELPSPAVPYTTGLHDPAKHAYFSHLIDAFALLYFTVRTKAKVEFGYEAGGGVDE